MPDMPPALDSARKSGLISPEQLLELLETAPERIRLVDASYPSNPSLPKIGNAQVFDIDDIADPDSPMPHMLPSPELFARKVGELGIGNNDFVICYDQSGIVMAASRAWWMFRAFGHDNVAVLDGGLIDWIRKNYPVTEGSNPAPSVFKSHFRPELVKSYEDMQAISASKSAEILDARPPERFVNNNIPGSKNIPALALIAADRHMKDSSLFGQDLKAQDITVDSPIVATCGSGVTACVVALALFREGKDKVAVYDGSWTEWSTRL